MESSDVSLCVLSAPDVLVRSQGGDWDLRLPSPVAPLVKDDTFILLNKTDLLPPPALAKLLSGTTWAVSLSTGHGTQAFMDSFARALHNRFASFSALSVTSSLSRL